jgi:hypothetical protein
MYVQCIDNAMMLNPFPKPIENVALSAIWILATYDVVRHVRCRTSCTYDIVRATYDIVLNIART